jgi:xylulokinase
MPEPKAGPLIAGLDIGTSRIKAAIFDPAGALVAVADQPTPTLTTPEGWVEYDAEALWQGAAACLRAAVAQLPDPAAVAGVGVASMAEAGVPLDAAGRPLAPVIAWFDRRTLPEAEWLRQTIGEAALFAASGLKVERIFGLTKILWFKRHRPEVFARTALWLNMADWIAYRLSGAPATDYSLASRTLVLDIHALSWNEPLLGELGIPASLLAPLAPSGAALGRVTADAAAATGLPRHAVVGVGGHDHVCGTFAAGAARPGMLLDSLGTAEGLLLATARPSADESVIRQGFAQGALWVDRPVFYLMGGLYTSGAAIEWFREASGRADHATLIAEAAAAPPGSGGVLFVPHLRLSSSPHPDDRARGAFVGLTSEATRGCLFRAVLEGLAFEAAAGVAGMSGVPEATPPAAIRAIGGNLRNRLLLEIKAAAYGQPIELATITESTALGGALCGGLAAGVYPDGEAAVAAVSGAAHGTMIEPDPALAARYRAIFEQVYLRAYAALRPLNHAIAALG